MRPTPFRADACLVVLAASAPVLIERLRGLQHAAGDLAYMFIPHYAWWWQRPRWLGGWNPWIFAGFPSNADPLVGHVHPLGLLWAAFPPLTASTLEGMLAPALAGLGMLVYLRSIGCERTGALLGALSFSLGGYVHAHAMHPEKLRVVLAIPWALAAIEHLAGRRLVAGLGAAVAVLVAGGHPQTIAFGLAVVGVYGLVFAPGRRSWMIAGLVAGIAVPAVTWLPAIELIGRGSILLEGAVVPVGRLPAACAHTLVVPFGCGGASGWFYGVAIQRFPGCGLVDCSSYPGMVVWLVLLAGIPRIVSTARGRFWVAAGVAGLVMSTGVLEGIVQVPGVRAPSRALLWWNLASAAAAGIAYRSDLMRHRRLWGAVLVLSCVIGWAATRDPTARRAAAGSLAALGVSMVAASAPSGGPAVIALVADLALFGMEMHAGARPSFANQVRAELEQAKRLLHAGDDPTGGFGRALYVPTLLQGMWAQVERVPIVQGWNVLVPAPLTRLLGGRSTFGYDMAIVRDPQLLAPASHVLDLLRVRIVAVSEKVFRDPRWIALLGADEARWIPAQRVKRGPQYAANERARPVAWLVHGVRIGTDDEALALVRGEVGPFDPTRQAVVQEPVTVAPAVGPEEVRVLGYDDDVITLHARASAAALLVTSELAHPGWRVWIDGHEARMRIVNAGFRAVEVPAGEHEVVFRYRPPLGHAGLAIGVVALLVLAVCAWW